MLSGEGEVVSPPSFKVDCETKFEPCHNVSKVPDENQWQKPSLSYVGAQCAHQESQKNPPLKRCTHPFTFQTILLMPNEDSRTQRDRDSNTTRRNLRSRRATSQRPTQPAPSTAMSEPRRSSLGNRQYMFIDQDAARSTSNEAIRVHVMRESHRARRQLRGLMQNNETHGQMTIFSSAPSSPRPVRQSARDRVEGQRSADQSPLAENDEDRTQREMQTMDNQELKRLAQTRLTAVLTTTSPEISAASSGFRILAGLPPNIVDLCEDDAGALHALLALVTSVQTSVSTLQTAEYESSALEILRARLAESSRADHSDETIITVLLLSRLERSRMNEETAGFHEAALLRMIRDRGGLDSLTSSNRALVELLRSCGLVGEDTIT